MRFLQSLHLVNNQEGSFGLDPGPREDCGVKDGVSAVGHVDVLVVVEIVIYLKLEHNLYCYLRVCGNLLRGVNLLPSSHQ